MNAQRNSLLIVGGEAGRHVLGKGGRSKGFLEKALRKSNDAI
jgi:hypothetical protein